MAGPAADGAGVARAGVVAGRAVRRRPQRPVARVELVGGLGAYDAGLPAQAQAQRSGSAHLDAHWRSGGSRRSAALVEVGGDGASVSTDGREVTRDDVARRLRSLDPDLVVQQRPYEGGWSGTLLGTRLPGTRLPGVLVPLLLGAGLATLLLLVQGPPPWRATRWAWFWLLPVPFAALAFCLLSGPTPGLRPRRTERRLTGGWAFLLGALLGGGAWAA